MLPQYVSLRRVRISRNVLMGRFSLRKPAMFQVPRKNLHTVEHSQKQAVAAVIHVAYWLFRYQAGDCTAEAAVPKSA
jgi:hypothetical protein